jgi:hypothetical protein
MKKKLVCLFFTICLTLGMSTIFFASDQDTGYNTDEIENHADMLQLAFDSIAFPLVMPFDASNCHDALFHLIDDSLAPVNDVLDFIVFSTDFSHLNDDDSIRITGITHSFFDGVVVEIRYAGNGLVYAILSYSFSLEVFENLLPSYSTYTESLSTGLYDRMGRVTKRIYDLWQPGTHVANVHGQAQAFRIDNGNVHIRTTGAVGERPALLYGIIRPRYMHSITYTLHAVIENGTRDARVLFEYRRVRIRPDGTHLTETSVIVIRDWPQW